MKFAHCLSTGSALGIGMLLGSAGQAALVYSQNFDSVPTSGGPPASAAITTSNAGPSGTYPDNVNYSSVTNASPTYIQAVADVGNIFGQGTANQYLQYVDDNSSDHLAAAPAALPAGTTGFQLTFDFFDPVLLTDTSNFRISLCDSGFLNQSVLLFFGQNGTLQAFHDNATIAAAQTKVGAYTTIARHSLLVVGNYGASTFAYGSESVAPGRYDAWIDGVLHPELNDAQFRIAVTSSTHFLINSGGTPRDSMNLDNIQLSTLPEPSSMLLIAIGIISGGMYWRPRN